MGPKKEKKNDQKSNESMKIRLNIFLSKIIPINNDFVKSILGKNNKPEQSPIRIKIND